MFLLLSMVQACLLWIDSGIELQYYEYNYCFNCIHQIWRVDQKKNIGFETVDDEY